MARITNTPHGDAAAVLGLHFCVPSKGVMPERGIHTLEHLFVSFMRNHLNGKGVKTIDISPTGCRTGFYMSLVDTSGEQRTANARKAVVEDMPKMQDQNQILKLNIYQCGTYQVYPLQEMQDTTHSISERDVRINSNGELAPPRERLQELYI